MTYEGAEVELYAFLTSLQTDHPDEPVALSLWKDPSLAIPCETRWVPQSGCCSKHKKPTGVRGPPDHSQISGTELSLLVATYSRTSSAADRGSSTVLSVECD